MAGESPSSLHCWSICGGIVLTSCSQNDVGRGKVCRNATLTLGRNQSRQIILQISMKAKPSLSYLLKDVCVHSKFAKDGKGSIRIPNKDVQILMSNCPPERLRIFLRTLEAKLRLAKVVVTPTASAKRTPLAVRNRLNAARPTYLHLPDIVDKLSPLSIGEIRKLRPELAAAERKTTTPLTSHKARPRTLTAKASQAASPKTAPSVKMEWSEGQRRVLGEVAGGVSVFFTGPAGTGKSLVLRKLIGRLPPDSTAVTAATGVAACHIAGTTLHHFAGIGDGGGDLERCLQLAARPHVTAAWNKCRHLIIDEISMVDGEYFTKLEQIARIVRRKNEPFGGIQLILCGDFLQLPPVSTKAKSKTFCFQSPAWSKCVSVCIGLRKIHRQADPAFIAMLNEIRVGRPSTYEALVGRGAALSESQADGILCTRLVTHKAQAATTNARALERLPGRLEEFAALDSDSVPDALADLLPPKLVALKLGAQVMLTRNLDLSRGLSNGARGVVVGFGEAGVATDSRVPRVRFTTGDEVLVASFRRQISRTQIPLQLAWAISIHKSQGMSLSRVEVSLGATFEEGQAYVGLSRATSLQGLRVLDFHPSVVRANADVLAFYDGLSLDGRESPPPLKRQRLSSQFR